MRTPYTAAAVWSDFVFWAGETRARERPEPLLAAGFRSRKLGRERNGPPSTERLRQPREHHKVSMECDPLKPTDAKRSQAVLVLESPELALDGSTATTRFVSTRSARRETAPPSFR
jgi:hypothetical protein